MNFKMLPGTQNCEGYCIIKSLEKRMTARGAAYLNLVLSDNDGDVEAKIWDYKETPDMIFEPYDFVKVRGQFVKFNEQDQFRIDRIRKVKEEDNVSIDDYVPSAVLPGSVMYDEIQNTVIDFSDAELKKLVMYMLEQHREKLIYWPAAKALHHAVRGGLLMHTLTMLRMADRLCEIYTYVNRDLLYAGVILHDIAKLYEIDAATTGVPGEYTTQGNLLGHLVMGAMEIDRAGRELDIDPDTLMLLEHMLISHHGVPEYGAAKYPMTIEAYALSALDDLDAKMYEFSTETFKVDVGSFTAKQWSLDNRILYNHGRQNDSVVELI